MAGGGWRSRGRQQRTRGLTKLIRRRSRPLRDLCRAHDNSRTSDIAASSRSLHCKHCPLARLMLRMIGIRSRWRTPAIPLSRAQSLRARELAAIAGMSDVNTGLEGCNLTAAERPCRSCEGQDHRHLSGPANAKNPGGLSRKGRIARPTADRTGRRGSVPM